MGYDIFTRSLRRGVSASYLEIYYPLHVTQSGTTGCDCHSLGTLSLWSADRPGISLYCQRFRVEGEVNRLFSARLSSPLTSSFKTILDSRGAKNPGGNQTQPNVKCLYVWTLVTAKCGGASDGCDGTCDDECPQV